MIQKSIYDRTGFSKSAIQKGVTNALVVIDRARDNSQSIEQENERSINCNDDYEMMDVFSLESHRDDDEVTIANIVTDPTILQSMNTFKDVSDDQYSKLCKDAKSFIGIKANSLHSTKITLSSDLDKLNNEQLHVFHLINRCAEGKNGKVFGCILVGGPGTGKSVLIRQLAAHGREKYAKNTQGTDRLICGSTGTAAYNVSGTTIHSFTI